jgi:uncharacterized SAM-binding protein YcdF (DUF218 family)
MFFFLSKTIGLLTQPLVLFGLLLLAGVLIRNTRWKKRLLLFSVALYLLWGNEFISNELLRMWELPPTPYSAINKQYEYGIVLTGVTKAQVGPPDRVFFARGADRATHAIQLYKLGIIRKIIISGGVGRLVDIGQTEAADLRDFMILCGVDRTHILVESKSNNTAESAREVTSLFRGVDPQQFLLITSAFHQRRSLACFKKQGWSLDHFSADPFAHARRYTFEILFVPDLDAWMNWQILFKEWSGMIMYRLAGYI